MVERPLVPKLTSKIINPLGSEASGSLQINIIPSLRRTFWTAHTGSEGDAKRRMRWKKGYRIDEWIGRKLEDWLGLSINWEKTKVVDLGQAESLDFLGFTFRYDRDLYGSGKTYLNVTTSKKSLKKARDAIREKTGPSKCYKPTPKVVKDLNTFLRGWSNHFEFGYPRKAFRDVCHYARQRMVTHLNRRSQRKYHRPKGLSHYQYLTKLGLQRL